MQSQVYPWRRYWARLFDITFIMPIYIFIIALFSPGLSYGITRMDSFVGGILLLLFYLIFFEPMMLSSFGTTPGKALLGIKIRALSGKKISYTTAMRRGFRIHDQLSIFKVILFIFIFIFCIFIWAGFVSNY